MKILIVEDDDFKLQQISTFVKRNMTDLIIEEVKSVHAGTRALRTNCYDLILLDMSLPTYTIGPGESGWRPQGYGGRDLLRYLERQGVLSPVIVITQFEKFESGEEKIDISTLQKRLEQEHSDNFRGNVYFNATSDAWQNELRVLLSSVHDTTERTDNIGNKNPSCR